MSFWDTVKEWFGSATENVQDQAQSLNIEELQQKAGDVSQHVGEQTQQTAEQVGQKVEEVKDKLTNNQQ